MRRQPKTLPIALSIVTMLMAATMFSASAYAEEPAAMSEGETVHHQGVWTKKSFASRGTWSIVEREDGLYVVLDSDFRTRGAPDLKIFLSPTSAPELQNSNAVDGSLLVAELSSNRGAQEYKIPDGTDLSAYSAIIIHCEAYTKLWSAADLA